MPMLPAIILVPVVPHFVDMRAVEVIAVVVAAPVSVTKWTAIVVSAIVIPVDHHPGRRMNNKRETTSRRWVRLTISGMAT